MNTLSYKTISANEQTVIRKWLVVDLEGEIVGRIASKIAHILRGKHKPSFTPHCDCGDYVIVLNADKIRFTGNKLQQKEYKTYTGYPGGQRINTPEKLLMRKPEYIIQHAVKGMLPKTKLGRAMIKKLFIYCDAEHPHTAQQPTKIEL